MKISVFYSWQSDLPNNTNRGFIESVIKKSIKSINSYENFELDICLERDTQGTPGSPNIVKTILDKIQKCDIFIADISIVTDGSGKNKRSSPNPNVLFELGYAVSCLGWDRIILFCNEAYGSGEKLPLDIQQHRRIAYDLEPEGMKAPARKQLENILKEGIIQIKNSLYESKNEKIPDLLLEWATIDYVASEKNRNGIEMDINKTNCLSLYKTNSFDNIEAIYEKDISEIKKVDGSIDPNWDEKVNRYLKKYKSFKEELESNNSMQNYFIDKNSNYARLTTLTINNTGLLPATDVRVKVELPEWILVFDKWPDKYNIPKMPTKPTASAPDYGLQNFLTGNMFPEPSDLVNPNITAINNRTSACYVKNSKIIMWSDKLLHKHELTIENDNFYLLPTHDAQVGKHKISASIFCVEYDNWKDIDLCINIERE